MMRSMFVSCLQASRIPRGAAPCACPHNTTYLGSRVVMPTALASSRCMWGVWRVGELKFGELLCTHGQKKPDSTLSADVDQMLSVGTKQKASKCPKRTMSTLFNFSFYSIHFLFHSFSHCISYFRLLMACFFFVFSFKFGFFWPEGGTGRTASGGTSDRMGTWYWTMCGANGAGVGPKAEARPTLGACQHETRCKLNYREERGETTWNLRPTTTCPHMACGLHVSACVLK